jgi:hypothetical protein
MVFKDKKKREEKEDCLFIERNAWPSFLYDVIDHKFELSRYCSKKKRKGKR